MFFTFRWYFLCGLGNYYNLGLQMYKSEDSGNFQLCWRKLWLQCVWRTIQWLHLLNCSPDYFVLISFFKPIRIHKKWVLNRTGSLEPEVGLDISTSMETLKKVVCCVKWSPHTLHELNISGSFFREKSQDYLVSGWYVFIKRRGKRTNFVTNGK